MSSMALPDQTIPKSQKTKEWHISHVLDYVSSSHSTGLDDTKQQMLKLYKAYNAELNDKESAANDAITKPHGTDLGLDYIVYPLVQTKLEQLVGEFMLRPIRRKAYVLDKKSKNAKFQKKLDLLAEEMMREYAKKMEQDLGFQPETQNPEIELPDDVEEFFNKDFKMLAEEVADNLIGLFLDVRKEKQKFRELFLDYCITDRCHAVLDKEHGHTTLRKVHPLDADYDINPYSVVQDNHEYFFENYWLSENEILNIFPLTHTQKEEVKEMFKSFGSTTEVSEDGESLNTSNTYDGWHNTSNKTGRLRVVSAVWKSKKRTSIKVSKSKKTGQEFYKKLNDESEARKNDKVENIDGENPHHVIMLGPKICLSWGEMEHRYSSKENPYICFLPVISLVRDNTTGTSMIKSPAAKLVQLQEMASEILFEIRLSMKSAGSSRVLVYDVAQTPTEFTKGGYESGLNKVMHHIKKDRLMVINSKQKGAAKNTFNQFTSLDLSQKGAVQDLFNGLAIIEDLASKFVGISPEREGQIGQYQTANNAERAIRGSTARTEVIYGPFDDFIQALLEKVLMRSKYDYEEGELLHFVFGDMKNKFIKLYKDFFESDLGVYLSDAYKDQEAADTINKAAEMALSTANTPEMIMGLIEVFEGESASEKKATFQRMIDSLEKMRKEQQQSAEEAHKREMESKAADRDSADTLTREGYAKDEKVAKIYADNKAYSDNVKTQSAEKIKAAELFQKQMEDKRSQNKPPAKK